MKSIKIKASTKVTESYLPTPRHRKLRYREVEQWMTVQVKRADISDCPIALEQEENVWLCEEGLDIPITIQYRAFQNELFVRGTKEMDICLTPKHNECVLRNEWCTAKEALVWLRNGGRCHWKRHTWANPKEAHEAYQEMADELLFVKNGDEWEVWFRVGEPRYEVCTFGLGHNHGGTGLFVTNHYNSNLPKEWFFRADQYEAALEKAIAIAEGRGDTESIRPLKSVKPIRVLMPETLRVNPAVEAGDGDEFHRDAERIAQSSDSAAEAGLLLIAKTLGSL